MADLDPLPVTVVPPDGPTALEYWLDGITAGGTLLAVIASVLLAFWANRDRRREVKSRITAEARLAAEQKARRQALHVDVDTEWQPQSDWGGNTVSGDLHGFVSARVANGSDRDITDVLVLLDMPLANRVYEQAPAEEDRRLRDEPVEWIPANAAHVVQGKVYTRSYTPPDPPPCTLLFTDAFGDEWRRDFDGALTLLKARRVDAE